jgi:RNA polymerase sigma factor (sigma-70 family)
LSMTGVMMMTTRYMAIQTDSASSNEASLISNARQGDLEAFNLLVLSYQDRVFNLAARILGDEEAAADITQNTFLIAYLNLARFRNGSFRSWLFRIAANSCYDIFRRSKRHPVLSIEDKELGEENLAPSDDFSSSTPSPEVELERHELAQVVQQALNQLDIRQRAVIILVDQQEVDYQEAAQILGIPVGTVKSRLARARLRLRQLLSDPLKSLQ